MPDKSPSFTDVIRTMLWAEFPKVSKDESRRLGKAQRDAQARGLGGGIVFAMYANECGDNLRMRGEWIWRTMTKVEPAPNEDQEQLTNGLKRIVREHLGHEGSDIPQIAQFARRHGFTADVCASLMTNARADRDNVIRELDARIGELLYKHAASRERAKELTGDNQRPNARKIPNRTTRDANDALWDEYWVLKGKNWKLSERQLATRLQATDAGKARFPRRKPGQDSSDSIRKIIRRMKKAGRRRKRPT